MGLLAKTVGHLHAEVYRRFFMEKRAVRINDTDIEVHNDAGHSWMRKDPHLLINSWIVSRQGDEILISAAIRDTGEGATILIPALQLLRALGIGREYLDSLLP